MSDWQSNSGFGDHSSSQGSSSAAPWGVHGNYSGNIGNNNIYGSGNIVNNYEGTNLSQEDEILRRLYRAGYEEQRKRVQKPVEGTCGWILEHPRYREWMEKQTSGVLWLSADPGYGKSVIASFLVGHLQTHTNSAVCYFFFKDDNLEQMSATFALCAILHQLFVKRRCVSAYAKEMFKAKGERFTGEVITLWDILVKEAAEPGCGSVFCVIDALDECEQGTRAQFISLLAGLAGPQDSGTPLKLLVTSRPYQEVEKGLCLRTPTIRLKGEEEVDAVTSDVARVIDDGITELELFWGRPGGLEYLRDLLQSSADRTFLWVSLVLAELKASEDCSSEELTRIVTTTPHDLGKFYDKILDKIKSRGKAQKILSIVVAAVRPLTLREMNVAFRINHNHRSIKDLEDFHPEFEKTVKNLCGHFVRIIDSKIYLVHQTAKEFLLKGSSPSQGSPQYSLCQTDPHYILADICISYLSLDEFKNDPLRFDEGGALANYRRKYHFFYYAATRWAGHFRDSHQQMGLFESTRLICEAGSKRSLTWFQVYLADLGWYDIYLDDWTHLMIASWLRQGMVVQRLLEEGGDINARCTKYGTALNIAAVRGDEDITRILLRGNVKAFIGGKEYNILRTKRSELDGLSMFGKPDLGDKIGDQFEKFMDKGFGEINKFWKNKPPLVNFFDKIGAKPLLEDLFEVDDIMSIEEEAIEFLKNFCIQDSPSPPSSGLSSFFKPFLT